MDYPEDMAFKKEVNRISKLKLLGKYKNKQLLYDQYCQKMRLLGKQQEFECIQKDGIMVLDKYNEDKNNIGYRVVKIPRFIDYIPPRKFKDAHIDRIVWENPQSVLINTFEGIESDELDMYGIDFSDVTYIQGLCENSPRLFEAKIQILSQENLKVISRLFNQCSNLLRADIVVDADNLTSFKEIFIDCSELKTVNIWVRSQRLRDISSLFSRCTTLENVDIRNIETENVIMSQAMFNQCSDLEYIEGYIKNDSLNNISKMFAGCESLRYCDIIHKVLASFKSPKTAPLTYDKAFDGTNFDLKI